MDAPPSSKTPLLAGGGSVVTTQPQHDSSHSFAPTPAAGHSFLEFAGYHVFAPPPYSEQEAGGYQIHGGESQLLELKLPPNGFIMTEPGTMVHMNPAMSPDVLLNGCGDACRRMCCAGESAFYVKYENQSPTPQIIGLTPPFPGKVIPLDLDRYSGLTIKRHSFLAAYDENVQFSVRMAKSASAGCCGGQGFVLNSLVGRGQAFLVAAGTVLERFLKPGEELLVQGHSVVAFEKTVDYDVRRVGGCLMCCCGGQGATNTVLRGPGMVLIQSMSIERMAGALRRAGMRGGGGGGG